MDNNSVDKYYTLKKYAVWGVVVGTAIWAGFFFSFLMISALSPSLLPDSWLLQMVQAQPGGTLGIGISAISAFSVVAVLDVFSNDPIEIRFWQLEIKGAAGPVVLWVLCFLAMVLGCEVLWSNAGLAVLP